MLRFDGEPAVSEAGAVAFADQGAVEKAAAVNLYRRFLDNHLQHTTLCGVADFGGFCKGFACAVYHEVVIVTVAQLELRVVRIGFKTITR